MTHEENIGELQLPGARELLETATLARLAYHGSDGFPRVVPVGFLWDAGRIVVCTATTAPKARALSSRPEVALTIDAGDTPATAKAVSIRGLATVEIVDGVPDEYLVASRKSMAPAQAAEFETGVRAFYDQMARISVEPRWARFFDFGAGRLPRFLERMMNPG